MILMPTWTSSQSSRSNRCRKQSIAQTIRFYQAGGHHFINPINSLNSLNRQKICRYQRIDISLQSHSKKWAFFKRIFKGFCKNAEIAQLVEHDLAKVGVASSSLVFRSREVIRNDGLFSYVPMGYVAPTRLSSRKYLQRRIIHSSNTTLEDSGNLPERGQ